MTAVHHLREATEAALQHHRIADGIARRRRHDEVCHQGDMTHHPVDTIPLPDDMTRHLDDTTLPLDDSTLRQGDTGQEPILETEIETLTVRALTRGRDHRGHDLGRSRRGREVGRHQGEVEGVEGEIVHLRHPEVEGAGGVQVTAAIRATVIAAAVEVEGGMGGGNSGSDYQVRKRLRGCF